MIHPIDHIDVACEELGTRVVAAMKAENTSFMGRNAIANRAWYATLGQCMGKFIVTYSGELLKVKTCDTTHQWLLVEDPTDTKYGDYKRYEYTDARGRKCVGFKKAKRWIGPEEIREVLDDRD